MIIQPSASPAPGEPLRFACTACGSALEVPVMLAGVTGPCPVCGEETTAPAVGESKPVLAPPAANAARLLSRPPPVRVSPPPLPPLPATAPVRPIAIPAEPVESIPAAAETEVKPFPVTARVPVLETIPVRPVPLPLPDEPPRRLLTARVKPVSPVPLVRVAVEAVAPPAAVMQVPLEAEEVPEPEKGNDGPFLSREPEPPVRHTAPLNLAELPPFFPPAPAPASAAAQATRPPVRRPRPLEERGIFKDGPQSQLLDIHEDIPLRTRHNWRRWVDIGIVSAFTGLLLATAAALRYTVPMDQAPPSWPPSNLTQQVEQEMQMQRIRKQEACELACAEVNRYLGAASELAASSYLIPPPPGMDAPAFPPFLSPPSEWTVSDSKRIPFTDRYLTIVKPANGESPVFMVEQTESGLFRLHAGPIAQQSMNLAGKFLASAGQGEATLYAEVRPTVPGFERGYRATRPDLDSYRLVDVLPAFSEKPEAFIACFKPGSDAAMYFSRRGAQDLNWRRVLVQVRWQVHREAGPWIEVVKFIPGPWSGDPPFPAPSATASLSPAN